jgi:hypothetical protein
MIAIATVESIESRGKDRAFWLQMSYTIVLSYGEVDRGAVPSGSG